MATAPTALSAPTPNAPRWPEEVETKTSPASAPPPTPAGGGAAIEAANAFMPGTGHALDGVAGKANEHGRGGHGAATTMNFDFDLNDMSWLTSAPVNL